MSSVIREAKTQDFERIMALYAQLHPQDPPVEGGADRLVFAEIVTEQGLRNQGLGQQVIGYALQFSWDRGCYKVMLQTGSTQESTHNFYKACGFKADDKFAFVARP